MKKHFEVTVNVDESLIPPDISSFSLHSQTPDGVITEYPCPDVNVTQEELEVQMFCRGSDWQAWLVNGTAPVGTQFDNSKYKDMYILCENIYQENTLLYDQVMKLCVLLCIIFLMTGLGVTMEPDKIIKHLMRPVGVTIATVVQFFVMPFICWGLAEAFHMDEIKMISMVILGCCPGGTMSNFMTLLMRGDMNLSILMSSVSTIVGIGAIPFMIGFISNFFLGPCTSLTVDTSKIIVSLAFTLAPCAVGMLIRAKMSERTCEFVLKLGKIMMVLGLLSVVITNILIFKMSVIWYFPIDMLIACALVPLCGFCVGFVCSYAACEIPRSRRTIMLETGLKNAQICLVILKVSFPIQKVGVLTMMPLYFLFFQITESAILALLFTKVLISTDEDLQQKLLEYQPDIERSSLQRQMSTKLAERTNTPLGRTSRSNTLTGSNDYHFGNSKTLLSNELA